MQHDECDTVFRQKEGGKRNICSVRWGPHVMWWYNSRVHRGIQAQEEQMSVGGPKGNTGDLIVQEPSLIHQIILFCRHLLSMGMRCFGLAAFLLFPLWKEKKISAFSSVELRTMWAGEATHRHWVI